MFRTQRCPVCKKPLSKREYERALGILDARERHLAHQKEELQQRLKEAKQRERHAREAGVQAERSRARRLLQGKEYEIQRLKDRVRQLQTGSTPQTEGLEFEATLVARLRREYPTDNVLHKGKGGDVLHGVCVGDSEVGLIVYECKRGPKIHSQHVRQAEAARRERGADFAVLVTTGRSKRFTGLMRVRDVLIVSPLGVMPLTGLLRTSLIEMHKARVAAGKRNVLANRMLDFITGQQFRNPIEHLVSAGESLRDLLEQEVKDHLRTWQRRKQQYDNITWDTTSISSNVQLVLSGKKPQSMPAPKPTPLLLPGRLASASA